MTDVDYAVRDGVNIAYRVTGQGPPDVVFVPLWFSNLDLLLELPSIAEGIDGFSTVGRVVMWDRRGSGLSDREPPPASLEEHALDLLAVMDSAGLEKTALFGFNESGILASYAAARFPERVSKLVLYGTYATTVRKDDYPWAPTEEERAMQVEWLMSEWGARDAATVMMAGGDERAVQWGMRWMRNSVSRDRLKAVYDTLAEYDVREMLSEIRCPTLVLHRRDDLNVPSANGRYIASKIPDARYVEFPGYEHSPFLGDWDTVAGEIEEFLTGTRKPRFNDRVLATIMFIDIVSSTEQAVRLGDARWRAMLDSYDAVVHKQLERFGGRMVKFTGDGSLATFDSPARAIRCAAAIRDGLSGLDIRVRCGVHTGEVELRGDDVGGIAVHIAARVMDLASAGEVLVSAAVPPLTTGSEVTFEDRGSHELRGVDGEWKIFAAT
jgi:pimeloyl-ACP methyl ester carboxylesterase/class 3 adenylate cyclase